MKAFTAGVLSSCMLSAAILTAVQAAVPGAAATSANGPPQPAAPVKCTINQHKVYVTYILSTRKAMDGVGGSVYCIPAGAENTEAGLDELRRALELNLKRGVVILNVQKLIA